MLQNGLTALHLAAARGEVEVINLLVKHGAAVDIRGGRVLNYILQTVHCTDYSTALYQLKMYIHKCSYNYGLAML